MRIFVIVLFLVVGSSLINADEPITVTTDVSKIGTEWKIPSAMEVRRELAEWLQSGNFGDEAKRNEILSTWPNEEPNPPLAGDKLFEQLIRSMSQATPAVAEFVAACDRFAWQELAFGQAIQLPQIPLQVHLSQSTSSKFLPGALKFYLAQRLIQARLYEEAGPILDELTPENSVDPFAVLISRAVVCHQREGEAEKGLEAIKDFKTTAEANPTAPRRYLELAKLLEIDLQKDKEKENPENISRQMDEVRRRLGKGRTDEDTQDSEKRVMKSLDKLIEKIEEQAQKQQQAQQQGDQGQQANKPADDSRILKQKGPGNVDRKDFNDNDNWGDLPPKEREEALLKIEKEFPAHYRDIIEQYFREMAGKNSDDNN